MKPLIAYVDLSRLVMFWLFASPLRRVCDMTNTIDVYYRRYRTRRQLARLSMAQLDDIGLDVETAKQESQKPFWL